LHLKLLFVSKLADFPFGTLLDGEDQSALRKGRSLNLNYAVAGKRLSAVESILESGIFLLFASPE
jgi:hypothetical protein